MRQLPAKSDVERICRILIVSIGQNVILPNPNKAHTKLCLVDVAAHGNLCFLISAAKNHVSHVFREHPGLDYHLHFCG